MLIKICGITTLKEVEFLNNLEIEYVGLVFCESKRRIDVEQGKLLVSKMKNKKSVGVFKNNSIEFIKKIYLKTGIQIIQLHGQENLEYIEDLKKQLNIENTEIWKGISVETQGKYIDLYKDFNLIIDGKNPGSGESFEYKLLKGVKRDYFLAGGLKKENIKNIPKSKKIIGLDISSGVEEVIKGKIEKSKEKIEEILGEVKRYEGKV